MAPKTSHRARIPRKILPANQIFVDQYQSGEPTSADSGMPTIPSDMPCNLILIPQTPSRTRRATVVTRSPDPLRQRNSLQLDVQLATSAPKRREKSKSQNDLGRPITPITRLEFEIERREFLFAFILRDADMPWQLQTHNRPPPLVSPPSWTPVSSLLTNSPQRTMIPSSSSLPAMTFQPPLCK